MGASSTGALGSMLYSGRVPGAMGGGLGLLGEAKEGLVCNLRIRDWYEDLRALIASIRWATVSSTCFSLGTRIPETANT